MKPRIFKNTDQNPDPEDWIYLIWDLDEEKRISCFKRLEPAIEALKFWKEKEHELYEKEEEKNDKTD